MPDKAEQRLPPKIFKPKNSQENNSGAQFLDKWIRIEFIIGGILLFFGGFFLRTTRQYDLVIIGGAFLTVALIRFFHRFKEEEQKKKQNLRMDRILFRLREQLDPRYSIALSYPVDEDEKLKIDYLVIGPGGIFSINRFEQRGYIEGNKGDKFWFQSPEKDSDKKNKLNNPLVSSREKLVLLQKIISKLPPPFSTIKPKNCVACTYHQVSGPVLEFQEIKIMEELVPYIHTSEQNEVLDWDSVKQLESKLNFNSYR